MLRHDPEQVRSGLTAIGLQIHTSVRRRPWFEHETTDHALLIATAS